MKAGNHQAASRQKRVEEPALKGHEIVLGSMVKNGYQVEVITRRGGIIVGRVTNFDRESITVKRESSEDDTPITIFKGAIETFTRLN